MGVSKLPVDMKPERWELIFYIVRRTLPRDPSKLYPRD
jgi:hypothetical protein